MPASERHSSAAVWALAVEVVPRATVFNDCKAVVDTRRKDMGRQLTCKSSPCWGQVLLSPRRESAQRQVRDVYQVRDASAATTEVEVSEMRRDDKVDALANKNALKFQDDETNR